MLRVSLLHLLTSKRRQAGASLAILLSVAFLVTTLLAGEAMRQGVRNIVGAEFRNIDLAVDSSDGHSFTDAEIASVGEIDGVTAVQPASSYWTTATANGRSGEAIVAPVPSIPVLRDALEIGSGRLPESEGEVVLHSARAKSLRVEIGETVSLLVPDPEAPDLRNVTREYMVVGTWTANGQFGSEGFDTLVSAQEWQQWSGGLSTSRLYVITDPGMPAVDPSAAIESTLTVPVSVTPSSALIDSELAEREEEWNILILGINAFAVLTLIVAAIVVSNTFSILITQRTRDIALFRCAGATSGQVRRMILFETAITGLVASIAGVVLAFGLAQVGLALARNSFDTNAIPERVMLSAVAGIGSVLVGLLVSVAAGWLPARSAMQIDPLQALRASQAPVALSERPSGVRILVSVALAVVGACFLLGGVFLSLQGSYLAGVAIGMVGGVIAFLAVLVGATVVVPVVARFLGTLVARIGGVPARVAAINSIRNPRRTTGTAMALVIGITLVTMMAVGASSLKSTLLAQVDAEVPLDLQIVLVDPQQEDEFRGLATQLESVEGVTAVASIERLDANLTLGGEGEQVGVYLQIANPDALTAVWRGDTGDLALAPGTIMIPDWVTEITGARGGDPIQLDVDGVTVTLEASENELFDSPVVSPADIGHLSGERSLTEVWLRVDDSADANAVTDAIYAQADESGVTIDVLATSDYRETLEDALDTMLMMVTVLLAVAVVISIVGVSNTLTLSVIERTRESALLRSLGFTRRQLRLCLAFEGLLLALISCVVGTTLGIAFGWIGALTVVGDAMSVSLSLPPGQIGAIIVAAIACGLIASVLPARRAVQADPVVALADV
jgi:putative ABC transport system permease protein